MDSRAVDAPGDPGEVVSKKRLRELQARSDGSALAYFAGHLAALGATGVVLHSTLGTLLVVPAIVLHGLVIVFLFAPLHECSHGTAFRTRWINRVVGGVCGAALLRPQLYFWYRHLAHHTYTQDARRDPQQRPISAWPEVTDRVSRTVRLGRNGTFELQNLAGDVQPRYLTGGFLGAAYAPLRVGTDLDNPSAPGFRVKAFDPPADVPAQRLLDRQQLLARVERAGQTPGGTESGNMGKYREKAVDLLEQHPTERRLASADVAGDDHEALAPLNRVLQQLEGVGVPLAAIEEFRIRREAERLLGEPVVAFVH